MQNKQRVSTTSACIYHSQGQLDTALDYYQRALALFEQVGIPLRSLSPSTTSAMIYYSQGQLDRALDYFQRALILFKQVAIPPISLLP